MASIARDPAPDATLALLREGYAFIGNRCARYGTDAFETRLMLERAICMQGAEAARLFYSDRFTRKLSLPRPVLTLLQDEGSVQGLDGEAHRHRKQLFLELLTGGSLERLLAAAADEWERAVVRWEAANAVVLQRAAHEWLCRTVCAWAGVPLSEEEAPRRAADFAAMVDGAGAVGPRLLRGQVARRRAERWVAGLVEQVRAGEVDVPAGTALHAIAFHRELDGSQLPTEAATVEVLNVLRPTVAIARYVAFCALALHEHPETRERAADGDEPFVQEVRRTAPFFPAIAGRTTGALEWRGRELPAGRWFLLDVYGTNRDGRLWDEPDRFRPERFEGWDGDPYTLIPQGGGDHLRGHRCPGEWTTIELMKLAVRGLTGLEYDVPPQDLRVRLSRIPAQPESGFVVGRVRGS